MTKKPETLTDSKLISSLLFVMLIMLSVAGLLVPIPGNSMLAKSLTNVAHIWLFLLLTFAVLWIWHARGWKSYLALSILLLLFGIVMELVQPQFGRSSSLYDIIKNTLGIAAGILLYIAVSWDRSEAKLRFGAFVCALGILTTSLVIPIAHALTTIRLAPLPVLANFDSVFSALRIETIGNSSARIVSATFDPAGAASRSLSVRMKPAAHSGFKILEPHQAWKDYKDFTFEVFNPNSATIPLKIRIDDKLHNQSYSDRFNKTLRIHPGHNKITIPIASIEQMGTAPGVSLRTMDISNITNVLLFLASPKSTIHLYFDNFVLQ